MAIYMQGQHPTFPGVPVGVARLAAHDEALDRGTGWSDPYEPLSKRHNCCGIAEDLRKRIRATLPVTG